MSTDGAVGPVRAWAHRTAPPVASNGILLIQESPAANGQLGGGNLTGLLTNPGVILTAAAIGTIIAVSVDGTDAS